MTTASRALRRPGAAPLGGEASQPVEHHASSAGGGFFSAPVGSTIAPCSSRIICAGVAAISPTSWVATTIVVPSRLSAVNRCSSRSPCPRRRCRSARRRPAARAGLITARAMATRCCSPPDSVAGGRWRGRRARPRRASRAPAPRSRPSHARRCAAARRHCRTPTGAGSGGNPGRRRRSAAEAREARRAAASISSSPNRRIRPRVGRWAR